jgi:hypothetical protein
MQQVTIALVQTFCGALSILCRICKKWEEMWTKTMCDSLQWFANWQWLFCKYRVGVKVFLYPVVVPSKIKSVYICTYM